PVSDPRRRGHGMSKIRPSLVLLAVSLALSAAASEEEATSLGPNAVAQIKAVLATKQALTSSERKLSFVLLAGVREGKGATIPGVGKLRSAVKPDAHGEVLVDIVGFIGKPLFGRIRAAGGVVLHTSEAYQTVRARVPLANIEQLASSGLVRHIRPSSPAVTQGMLLRAQQPDPDASPAAENVTPRPAKPGRLALLRPGFPHRPY